MRKFWLALAVLVAILLLILPWLWALVGAVLVAVGFIIYLVITYLRYRE
jgi:hypothetical protein